MPSRRRNIDDAAIERLVGQRRDVVGRAVHLLDFDREVPIDVQPEALRESVALLSVSLEELKVAEEELLQQNEELAMTREAAEAATQQFRRIFDEAPIPYVVTDVCGLIRHANRAAAIMLKRPREMLEGVPLPSYVPLERRGRFRDAINRLQLVDTAHDWQETLLRHRDEPVSVTIDVRVARGAHDGEELMCWLIRPARRTSARVEAGPERGQWQ